MSRIRQLAMDWEQSAAEDLLEARRYPTIRPAWTLAAMARKNCAWELMRVLNELEKENPLEGGFLRSAQSDSESA